MSVFLPNDIPSRFIGISSINYDHPYCIIFVDVTVEGLEDYVPHTVREFFLNLPVISSSIDDVFAKSVLVFLIALGLRFAKAPLPVELFHQKLLFPSLILHRNLLSTSSLTMSICFHREGSLLFLFLATQLLLGQYLIFRNSTNIVGSVLNLHYFLVAKNLVISSMLLTPTPPFSLVVAQNLPRSPMVFVFGTCIAPKNIAKCFSSSSNVVLGGHIADMEATVSTIEDDYIICIDKMSNLWTLAIHGKRNEVRISD
ncbi:hypothetical protein HAX54_006595 [Datura stramonium]|uniref:Uncharacterized protein n=1 Tax=Datura stramonium TaxID=4076 RepID=A0ABS8TBS4_DATST|nr:hypothetical protein [Datura stramonium]